MTDIKSDPSVVHGGNLQLSGTVQNLNGRTMWLVAKPDRGDGFYLTQKTPVAIADGTWNYFDEHIGDESDIGFNMVYYAFAANDECESFLLGVTEAEDGSYLTPTIDSVCGSPIGQHAVAVK